MEGICKILNPIYSLTLDQSFIKSVISTSFGITKHITWRYEECGFKVAPTRLFSVFSHTKTAIHALVPPFVDGIPWALDARSPLEAPLCRGPRPAAWWRYWAADPPRAPGGAERVWQSRWMKRFSTVSPHLRWTLFASTYATSCGCSLEQSCRLLALLVVLASHLCGDVIIKILLTRHKCVHDTCELIYDNRRLFHLFLVISLMCKTYFFWV